ncbi:hypothetical protein [Rhodococcus opacus]|uniref:hypothetical protein n=1 Tax=Rhodococcus opacus TaxID=37919 RepID=UPI001C43A584|nr:hypothetical protein [Rhodococcus opacus]MBV6761430.1 hypothetical protein [Rhodococcus opacus]
MVAPLALLALIWDRRGNRAAALLTDRTLVLRVGRRQRRLSVGTAAGGVLMIGMGALALVLAFTGPGMPSGGWQAELSGVLQHASSVAVDALSFLPGWVLALVLVAGFGLLVWRATRPRRPHHTDSDGADAIHSDAERPT